MKTIRITMLAAALLSMLSCGIYKKYERPEGCVSDGLFGYQVADSSSIADFGWEELFTDPYLDSLISRALDRNTDIRTAMLNVDKAEAALKTARLDFLPSFNFAPQGSAGGFNNFSSLNTGASWTYTVPVAASWEIDVFGKKTNRLRSAKVSLNMADDYAQAAKSALIAGIARQYYTLLMLDEQLRIAGATADKFRQSVEVLSAMCDAGMSNEAAVSSMRAAIYEVEAAKESILQAITEVENSLCSTLFETPHSIERGILDDAAFPEELKTGVPAALLSRRPDVRAAENALAASYYAVNIARASLYPSLSLSGTAGWTNSLGSSVVNPSGLILNAAASLLQPIFNAGALRAQVRIARDEQEAAELAFRQCILNAGTEVNNALSLYQRACARIECRERQIEAQKDAVEKTELLMRFSSNTYLEVLTAEQSLLSAENAMTQDRFDRINAVISLYHALGGM